MSAAFLSCLAWGDVVVLKNGDRVTGAIVKKDGKTLTIKTDHFGLVTTDWDQVTSIKADKPVNVVLPDGKTVQGTLDTTNGKVEIAASGTRVDVAPAEIAAIRNAEEQHNFERLLHPGWTNLWAGTAAMGIAGALGNAQTLTFTTSLTASRATKNDKTTVYFDAIRASAAANRVTSDTAKAVRGGLSYDRNIGPRVFTNVFNDYEYDRFQNLNLRFVAGGGLGYHLLKGERVVFDVVAGGAYNHSSYTTPSTTAFGEAYVGDDFKFKLNSATTFVQSFRAFDDLENTAMKRMNFDFAVATRLKKWLTWNISLSDRYVNPPAIGRKSDDLLYTTGLGISFARK